MFEKSNAIYRRLTAEESETRSKHNIQLYRINGLDIPFSPSWKKIGINLSGGADSACLTYLLCKIITENNFNCKIDVITHVRCWTTRPWQQPISIDVFVKLKNMFPNIIGNRHENFITPELEHGVSGLVFKDLVYKDMMRSGDQVSVAGYNQYCLYRYKLDAVFNATTHNPPNTDFPKKMDDREKSVDDGVLRDLIIENSGVFLCHPFRFVDKSWVLAQYHLFKITELLDITRSCEGDVSHKRINPTIPDYTRYSPGMTVPECGSCFWCLERDWAKSKLEETLGKLKNV